MFVCERVIKKEFLHEERKRMGGFVRLLENGFVSERRRECF